MIGEIAIKFALQESIKSCAKFLKEKKLKIDTTSKDVEDAIASQLKQVNNWSKEISFTDLKKAKLTSQVFIDVDIFLMPKKSRINLSENIDKVSCKEIFGIVNKHCVILGQPGAGKTTLMKSMCQSVMLDESYYPEELKFPIIIRLRELNTKSGDNPIINSLFDTLGLVIKKEKADSVIKDEDITLAKERILFPILENTKPLIILDGYDEISSQKMKERVIDDFKRLTLNLSLAKVILTSRSSDYSYSIENTAVLEICPLNEEQIKKFATRWLEDEDKVQDFLKSLAESPFVDTAIRPLTISHLCAIYERVGKIPDKPKTVYKKIVNLLLEEWDEQRAIKRISDYGNFEIDRKFEFLCRMAYEITVQYRKTIFTEQELKYIYGEISPDYSLAKAEASKVIKELEGHTGLIIQSGYKDYEFAHKSIHEYLCSEHLVKLPSIPINETLLGSLPNELAIATTISSNPSLYFCELILNRFFNQRSGYKKYPFDNTFITTFVNRLVLEKPDFNLSSNISFASVVLYTMFRRGETGQLRLFDFDLPIQFEKFIELIFKRNKKFEYETYYEIDESYGSETSEPILKLKRNTTAYKFSNEPISLPNFLYAKKSFVSGFDE